MLKPACLFLSIAVAGCALLILTIFVLIDRGLLDGPIRHWASARLGRPVRFAAIETHLLSRTPCVTVRALAIGNPEGFPRGDVAMIGMVTAEFAAGSLLTGHPVVARLTVDRPVLHLIRFGPGHNNWSISRGRKSGPPFAPLRDVTSFSVSSGLIDLHDHARDLHLIGRFDQAAAGPLPFHMTGSGILKGGAIRFVASGGALHGNAVGRSYPFVADLIDGTTSLRARGTSGDPFDLSRYALSVDARGSNLANIGYLFNLLTPNSRPFVLSAHASSDGKHLRFDDLKARLGVSDVTGRIWSDHGTRRRDIFATFVAGRLDRQDIDAMLAPVPPRASARIRSGAVAPGLASRWILNDAPIGISRLRSADFDFDIHIASLTGYALPLTNVSTRIDLDHGLLDVPKFGAGLYSGRVSGAGRLDARTGAPVTRAAATLEGVRLADVPMASPKMQGAFDMRFDLAGTGDSIHAAAATASGSASLRMTRARIPASAAWMLGGDLVRAMAAKLGGGGQTVSLDCAAADLRGTAGRLSVVRLALATPMGVASGSGHVDLATERIMIDLAGTASQRRLFQVAAPVRIEGPWLSPAVTVLPGRKAQALGLRGKIGVLLTPLAGLLPLGKPQQAQPACR